MTTTPIQTPTNTAIADALDQLADRLVEREVNPHRIRAYRQAAESVRGSERPLTEMVETGGTEALERLYGVGDRIASRIAGFIETGKLRPLERIRNTFDPRRLFGRVPGIGPELAQEIYDQLGIKTLEELEMAAHDGRLEAVEGFGRRRVRAVRNQLSVMLQQQSNRRAMRRGDAHERRSAEPPVPVLLEVDAAYREKVASDELPRIAPRRFNPGGDAWLPLWRTSRGPWYMTVLFSNTALAHDLDRTNDWVVIYTEHRDGTEHQYTVVTETKGPLAGERVVRGREAACRAFYEQPKRAA